VSSRSESLSGKKGERGGDKGEVSNSSTGEWRIQRRTRRKQDEGYSDRSALWREGEGMRAKTRSEAR